MPNGGVGGIPPDFLQLIVNDLARIPLQMTGPSHRQPALSAPKHLGATSSNPRGIILLVPGKPLFAVFGFAVNFANNTEGQFFRRWKILSGNLGLIM